MKCQIRKRQKKSYMRCANKSSKLLGQWKGLCYYVHDQPLEKTKPDLVTNYIPRLSQDKIIKGNAWHTTF